MSAVQWVSSKGGGKIELMSSYVKSSDKSPRESDGQLMMYEP